MRRRVRHPKQTSNFVKEMPPYELFRRKRRSREAKSGYNDRSMSVLPLDDTNTAFADLGKDLP